MSLKAIKFVLKESWYGAPWWGGNFYTRLREQLRQIIKTRQLIKTGSSIRKKLEQQRVQDDFAEFCINYTIHGE